MFAGARKITLLWEPHEHERAKAKLNDDETNNDRWRQSIQRWLSNDCFSIGNNSTDWKQPRWRRSDDRFSIGNDKDDNDLRQCFLTGNNDDDPLNFARLETITTTNKNVSWPETWQRWLKFFFLKKKFLKLLQTPDTYYFKHREFGGM